MDAIHQEFEDLLAQAASATDVSLPQLLDALQTHLQAHFDEEDRWMRETDFPAAAFHMNEHAAVLRSAEEVHQQLAARDTALDAAFVAKLSRRFPGHADYLDSALAHSPVRRQNAGIFSPCRAGRLRR